MGACLVESNADGNTNNDDKTTESGDFLAVWKDQTNGLFYQTFEKYVKFQSHLDNSLSDDEVVAEIEPYMFIVAYILAADGIDEKERDLLNKAINTWTEGNVSLERGNKIITEGGKCKDEELILEKVKQLSNLHDPESDGGFNDD